MSSFQRAPARFMRSATRLLQVASTLPLPTSVYRGLWQKWQRFAPASLQLDERIVTAVEQSLFPARYALRTEVVNLKGVPQVGCVGTCQFELLERVSTEDRRAIATLSRFAAYAGVGMKTTMGMGQTMVEVEEAPTQGHKPVGEENGEGT